MANPKNNTFSLDTINSRYLAAFAEAWHFNASSEAHARVADLGRDLAECYEDQARDSSFAYRDLAKARELRDLATQHDEAAGRTPLAPADPAAVQALMALLNR